MTWFFQVPWRKYNSGVDHKFPKWSRWVAKHQAINSTCNADWEGNSTSHFLRNCEFFSARWEMYFFLWNTLMTSYISIYRAFDVVYWSEIRRISACLQKYLDAWWRRNLFRIGQEPFGFKLNLKFVFTTCWHLILVWKSLMDFKFILTSCWHRSLVGNMSDFCWISKSSWRPNLTETSPIFIWLCKCMVLLTSHLGQKHAAHWSDLCHWRDLVQTDQNPTNTGSGRFYQKISIVHPMPTGKSHDPSKRDKNNFKKYTKIRDKDLIVV